MASAEKKILIVEDDPIFVSILKEKFSQEGFLTFTAQDGKEGLGVLEREKPDLVIADVLLPILSGLDMAKQIKEKNEDAPIIFLTNVKDDSHLEEIKEMKKVDYLIKSDISIDNIIERAKLMLMLKNLKKG